MHVSVDNTKRNRKSDRLYFQFLIVVIRINIFDSQNIEMCGPNSNKYENILLED